MAQTVKRKSNNSSKVFPIVISVAVAAMLVVVIVTVSGNKKKVAAQSKIEVSDSVSVTSASVNGKIGESTLSSFTDQVAAGTDPDIGKIVPKITAQDFSGKRVTIAPTDGKPYVLTLVAHWCPHCREEVPKLVKMEADGKLPTNVDFIAVATGTNKQSVNYPPSSWLRTEQWPWSKIADSQGGDIAKALGLTGYPYVIYVNADGTVAKRTSGEQDEAVIIAAANEISKSKP